MTDIERLRAAFKVSGPDDVEGHVSETQWENLACGELNPGDREAVLDHILGCSQCTELHQALLVLREQAHTFDSGAPVPEMTHEPQGRPSSRAWIFAGVLTVAAALVVVIFSPLNPGLTIFGPSDPSSPVVRSPQNEQTAKPLSPIGPISMSGVVFSWTPSPVTPISIVQLIDDSGEEVWTSEETESTSIEWPSGVSMRPGRYYWRVLSVGGEGGLERASELVAFDLTGPFPSTGTPPS